MPKNKKIFFVVIICGLALTLAPSFVSAADSYRCWCGNTDSASLFGWPACETGCPKQCELLHLDGKPTCDLIKSAQTPAPSPSGTKGITNPLRTADLPTLIGQIIKAVLGIVGSIALLMFIYGGFLWMTSRGNEQSVTKGKNVITWATIGLAVIFLSYALVGFIISGLTKGAAGNGGGGEENLGPTGYCKCQNAEENAWMTQNLCDTARCTWELRDPTQGCCVVGGGIIKGGSCFSGAKSQCTNGSFNDNVACNHVPSCQ